MSMKSWKYDGDVLEIFAEDDNVRIIVRDRYEGAVASIILRGVEPISEIIEHLKTFLSKPLDPIKRSEIPTVDDIRARLQERRERDNEAVDKLVKHYILKITEVMRKQEPHDNLTYSLDCDPLSMPVLARLSDSLVERGWVLQYKENPLYPHSAPYAMTLQWKPRPTKEEK